MQQISVKGQTFKSLDDHSLVLLAIELNMGLLNFMGPFGKCRPVLAPVRAQLLREGKKYSHMQAMEPRFSAWASHKRLYMPNLLCMRRCELSMKQYNSL